MTCFLVNQAVQVSIGSVKWHFSLLLSGAVLGFGCAAPSARSGDFYANDPASKLYAIIEAGRTKDRTSIGPLVEQLDNDDPLVRFMTINALQHITGTRLGYNPYVPAADRQPATRRWVQAVNNNRFDQAPPEP